MLISFTKDDFAMLAGLSNDLIVGRNTIGVDELGDESEGLMSLCTLAGVSLEDFNQDELLTIEAVSDQETGEVILTNVYAPAIWWNQPQITETEDDEESYIGAVLRVGSNVFPVTVEKGVLSCGELTADFTEGGVDFETVENLQKECYLVGTVLFAHKTDEEMMFTVGLRLDGKKNETKTKQDCMALKKKLAGAFKSGDLKDYLMEIGAGGTKTIKMHELGSGEFPVESITELELIDRDSQEKRVGYTIQLVNGASVWAGGNVASLLNSKKLEKSLLQRNKAEKQVDGLPSEKVLSILHIKTDLMLIIGKIEPKGQGFSVANKFAERSPMLAPAAAEEPKQLVAAGATEKDEIPF